MNFSDMHEEKERFPKIFKDFGRETDFRYLNPKKHLSSSFLTEGLMLMC
jgi:hypothetical protein